MIKVERLERAVYLGVCPNCGTLWETVDLAPKEPEFKSECGWHIRRKCPDCGTKLYLYRDKQSITKPA